MSNRKPFDARLYQENDALAKAAAIELLKLDPHMQHIRCNPDQYGVDLQFSYGEAWPASGMECEVKRVWHGNAFPYDTVQVPHRKAKYFEAANDYLLLAANAQDCLIIYAAEILDSPVVEVPNIYVNQGEYFFQVPLHKAQSYRFEQPINPADTFCCGEMSLSHQGDAWVCEACGEVSK